MCIHPSQAWVPVGWLLSGTWVTTMTFFNNASAFAKYTGLETLAPGATGMLFAVVAGAVALPFVLGRGVAVHIVLALELLVGSIVVGSTNHFFGAVILGIAMPKLWAVTWLEFARLARARSAHLAAVLAGVFTVIYYVVYLTSLYLVSFVDKAVGFGGGSVEYEIRKLPFLPTENPFGDTDGLLRQPP